jgi:hypothetical protein
MEKKGISTFIDKHIKSFFSHLVRLPQELHLPVCEAEAFWEDPLYRYLPVVKLTPGGDHRHYICYFWGFKLF